MATILLVAFALVIGTLTMNWGKNYVEKLNVEEPSEEFESSAYVVSIKDIGDDPLKQLQMDYITGKITKEEYEARERGINS